MAWVRDLQEILLWQAGVQCTLLFNFNEVLYHFPLIFSQSAQLGQQQEEQKEKQMILLSPKCWEFFAVKVGCECPLQSHTAPHLKDEETWLHL